MPRNIEEIKAEYRNLVQSIDGAYGAPASKVNLREALTTNDLNIYMPKAMEVIMLDAAEPEYLASKFVKTMIFFPFRSSTL